MAHITQEQRYTISCMLSKGYKQKDIADAIGKDKSVISREIKRNADGRNGVYRHDLADRKYAKRQKEKPKRRRFNDAIKQKVIELIEDDYSPEQIVGCLKNKGEDVVSVERIYQFIWLDKKQGGKLHKHLRRQGRKYRKRGAAKDNRGIIKDRVGIEKRPKVVEERKRFGDLEVDLIIGKNHKQAMLTINDRASGMLKICKVESKEAKHVGEKINEQLMDWLPYIKTITADNGKEFADHLHVSETLGIDYYFARPYHSWERGSNENLNGLVRQYFKKGSDFTSVTDEQIQDVEKKLNERPRKRYNFVSPIEKMNQLLFNQEVAFVT